VGAPEIVIVTPALAAANNGNWRTARRWARFLSTHYRVRLTDRWQGGDEAALIALHARRSAASILAWRNTHPGRPLLLVLTGTDLYRDIAEDASARQSLHLADRLVVLNELGLAQLPTAFQAKASVCLQSSPTRRPLAKPTQHLRALMVGHLREEKSPGTYFEAARRLAHRPDILLDHIGGALDPALGDQAHELSRQCPAYRWLGDLPHAATRARIQAAHVLVHASRLEGGAQVVIEAISSGTPVIASRIDGNLGLLGAGYPGCFEWNDAHALAALLLRARDDAAWLPALSAWCAVRAPLFQPEREKQTVLRLLASTLPATPDPKPAA
jgi:putative glycosyltransferase (TIGR04348 family)